MISKGFIKSSSLTAILWLVASQCFAHEMRPAFAQLLETERGSLSDAAATACARIPSRLSLWILEAVVLALKSSASVRKAP